MSFARTIYRKLRTLAGRENGLPYEALLRDGIVKAGSGCDLNSMQVILVEGVAEAEGAAGGAAGTGRTGRMGGTEGGPAVEMGNNCCVRGTIMVYRPGCKVVLGDNVYIGPGTFIECTEGIEIGSNTLISMHCHIIDTNSHSLVSAERMEDRIEWQKGLAYKDWSKVQSAPVKVGEKCWIGLRSIVLKGVVLGEGSIVAAGSVVTESVKPYTIVGGNPARFIKETE